MMPFGKICVGFGMIAILTGCGSSGGPQTGTKPNDPALVCLQKLEVSHPAGDIVGVELELGKRVRMECEIPQAQFNLYLSQGGFR